MNNKISSVAREVVLDRTGKAKYMLAASVALFTFIIYLPALRNEFVYWDDSLYIFENVHIRSLDASFFRWAFLDFQVSNWHPLTWISHAVDYALWGLNPLGHHLSNIILHAVNTALVVLLMLKLFEFVRERSTQNGPASFLNDRATLIAAAVTGLLFGIHPVHVESVAWVAERKDLLCALFFLISITMYANYAGSQGLGVRGQGSGVNNQEPEVRSQKSEGNRKDGSGQKSLLSNSHYLAALCFFALALMSKPMAVTLPVVLLILDWYPFNRIGSFKTFRAATAEKIPFLVMSLASSIVTILAQKAGGAVSSIENIPLSIRLPVAAKSLIAYLGKMLLPMNLSPFYPYPREVNLFSFEYLFAIVLLIGITAACVALARKQKFWLSAWGYYVVTLIPVLGIAQVGSQAMADRYAYLPSLGPFLIAGVGVSWIAQKVNIEERWGLPARVLGVIIALFLTISLSYLTVQQTVVWRNSLSLWTYVIEKEPERIPLAYNNRGMVFYKAGTFDKAIADFDKAIALDPRYAKAYYNRGLVFDKMGALDKAIADYKKTISLDPYYYEAYYFLDQALKKTGQVDKRTL